MRINKKLVTGNLNILRFLYPSYKLQYNIDTNPSCSCIYIGDISDIDKLKLIYESKNLDFIVYTKNFSEININDRFTLASIVFDKYNRHVPAYLNKIIGELDEDVFINCIKYYWITGKWLVKEIDKEDTFLDFIDSINKSTMQTYQSYFRVTKYLDIYKLESSFFTFLLRAKEKDMKDMSYFYKNKLKSFDGDKLDRALLGLKESLDYNIDNNKLRLLNTIVCIMDKKTKM